MNSQSCQVTENRNKNKNRNTKKTQNTTTDLMQVVDFSSSCVISKKKLVMVEKKFQTLIIHSMTLHNTLTAQSAEDVQCTPTFVCCFTFVHANLYRLHGVILVKETTENASSKYLKYFILNIYLGFMKYRQKQNVRVD